MSVLFVENLRFLDTTLRDGEQTPGVSLNPDQKFEIATRLSDIGVDVIEAGSAAASDGEREAIRRIADAGLAAEVCTFVRALHADIDYAADCGADSIHLVVPVSDLHIAKKMRKTRDEVVAMAMDAVEYAKSRGSSSSSRERTRPGPTRHSSARSFRREWNMAPTGSASAILSDC